MNPLSYIFEKLFRSSFINDGQYTLKYSIYYNIIIIKFEINRFGTFWREQGARITARAYYNM